MRVSAGSAALRKTPDGAAEQVNQILFGEPVRLYLRDGEWDGRRILPEGWVDFARTKAPPANSDVYGAGFWVTPAAGRGKPYVAFAPDGPRDIFLAQGHEGQVVVVVPSKDLVLVRLGLFDDFVGWRPLGEWAVGIINLFPDVLRN